MGDFIKELTIIDFLGMLIPGSFLVLLFDQSYHLQFIWTAYFPENTAADTVILLVIGYIVGMLLHEVGDIIEGCLWNCMLLNPRYHAAKKVFKDEEQVYTKLRSSDGQLNQDKFSSDGEAGAQGESQTVRESQPGKGCIVRVFKTCFFPLFIAWQFLHVIFFAPKVSAQCPLCGVVAGVLVGGIFTARILTGKNKERGFLKIDPDIEKKVHENAAIQTQLTGRGNESKRRMFDGFYAMMRNLLLAIAFTNAYAFWGTNSSALADHVKTFYQDNMQYMIYVFICLAMLWRGCHYAYLKYKYSYEDYLLYEKEQREKGRLQMPFRACGCSVQCRD